MLLAVLCGLRRGEIAALRWKNIDLTAGQIAVIQSASQTRTVVRHKEPKSDRSRTVALSITVLEELRAHRLRQAQELLRLGTRLSDETFVCARDDGLPLQPDSFTHDWDRQDCDYQSLPQSISRPSLCPRDAHARPSERLGHSKIGITLDLYSHVLPNM